MHIIKPTLLIDENKAIDNLKRISEKAAQHSLQLRPHLKTHQSAEIAEWGRPYGVFSQTVSSISMAQYIHQYGWTDITIAIPHNPRETDSLGDFPDTTQLHIVVDHVDTLKHLGHNCRRPLNIWLKIDVGYHRCGIPWDDVKQQAALSKMCAQFKHLTLLGVLTHAGHSYLARNHTEVNAIHQLQVERMAFAKQNMYNAGFSGLEISIGDTPCCVVGNYFDQIDEIRPGNFIFFDVDQLWRNVCAWQQIALVLACPIIGVYPGRKQLIVHGGAIHLSKESRFNADFQPCFGLPVMLNEDGWGAPLDAQVSALSQEHGVITFNSEYHNQFKVGDLIGILPIHSCLTADLSSEYWTLSGRRIPKWRLGTLTQRKTCRKNHKA